MKKNTTKKLFQASKRKFGSEYHHYFFEQYKVFINSLEHTSRRHQKTSDFFLALNTGLIAILGIVSSNYENAEFILVASALIGMVVCYFWYRIIKVYQWKSRGKFKVIYEIEKKLPLALYKTEWEIFKESRDEKNFTPFTAIESKIPWIFIVFYVVIWIWIIFL